MTRKRFVLFCLLSFVLSTLIAPLACRARPRLPVAELTRQAASGVVPMIVQGPASWFGATTAAGPDCGSKLVTDLKAQHAPDSVFQAVVVRLFEKCPVGRGVIVHVLPLANQPFWGKADRVGDVFVVEIASEAPEAQQIDVLTHEWAHLMVWDLVSGTDVDPHGQAWGMAFSRAYMTSLDGAGH